MNALRDNLFTGSPMSRYEFAIRLISEGAAPPRAGIYPAGTLLMANALFSSMPIETLLRMGGPSTAEDVRLSRIVERRQRGKLNDRDRAGDGPWPHHPCGVRDFMAREIYQYVEEVRERLMSERRSAGLSEHGYIFVTSAAESSEIASPYTLAVLEEDFRRALKVLGDRYPESYARYEDELSSVDRLGVFLRWKLTPGGRVVDDPLNDVQASLLLHLNSPMRVEAGDAMKYINSITDQKREGRLPGLGG